MKPNFTPEHWRDFPEVFAESLWQFDQRADTGANLLDYHGAFVPQIAEQFIQRFTNAGELVLDPMCGSGTTLAVARNLGRDSIGCDISKKAAESIRETVIQSRSLGSGRARIVQGDICLTETISQMEKEIRKLGHRDASLLILHPPYFNIIKFTELKSDLSQSIDIDDFLTRMALVFDRVTPLVKDGGVIAVVIGDIYYKSAWFPLAFRLLDILLQEQRRLSLRGIVVKNMANSRAKRRSSNLWRYRSLKNQTYLFSHEYILVLRKNK